MRILRNTVSLLCALALLLSLAPCVFADSTPIDETVPVDGGSFYETEGPVTIADSGAVVVSSTEDEPNAIVHFSGTVTNKGTIQGNAVDEVNVQVEGNLRNDGSIDLNVTGGLEDSEAEDAYLDVYGNIVNNGSITITAPGLSEIDAWDWEENGSGGCITNNGTITVKATGGSIEDISNTARVVANCDIINNNQITLESSVETDFWLDGRIENRGTISLTGCEVFSSWDDELEEYVKRSGVSLEANGGVTNYDTINITIGDRKQSYFGVNYVDDEDVIQESALTGDYNWKSGMEGTEIQLKTQEETREGQTFFWMVNGVKYNPGAKFTVTSVTSIKAFWEAIINNTPSNPIDDSNHAGSEKVEKSGEKIMKYIDGAKVMDANRRVMEMETEYYKVAKTSYNRLIVTFTWQQMAEMAEGEHLFYIVEEDGTETEYVLTIW